MSATRLAIDRQRSVLEDAAQVVLEVRERPDGLGYPARLRAAGVSLAARIVSASDAYDTMIHQRVFRDALGFADALLELERCSGTQFDPNVVRVLKRLVTVN
jgi:HD-GYP domain-containing protein (c-di-GMP phosphodiesterase class II)